LGRLLLAAFAGAALRQNLFVTRQELGQVLGDRRSAAYGKPILAGDGALALRHGIRGATRKEAVHEHLFRVGARQLALRVPPMTRLPRRAR